VRRRDRGQREDQCARERNGAPSNGGVTHGVKWERCIRPKVYAAPASVAAGRWKRISGGEPRGDLR
jgi:hypothetical protein